MYPPRLLSFKHLTRHTPMSACHPSMPYQVILLNIAIYLAILLPNSTLYMYIPGKKSISIPPPFIYPPSILHLSSIHPQLFILLYSYTPTDHHHIYPPLCHVLQYEILSSPLLSLSLDQRISSPLKSITSNISLLKTS